MAEKRARTRAVKVAEDAVVAPKSADEQLATYAKKRKFDATPEPSGEHARTPPSQGEHRRFVIQMHRASRLHWDFRLESDGVLKSWAVPKGPCLDTSEKRFAASVEDHPLDYFDFEGIIPKGNYGAGEVVVWDWGTYRLLEGTDASAQIAKGSLKFELFGEKLHGGFALVHIKGRGSEENAWLLIKERDDAVDKTWKIEDHPESVKTGKTLDDYAKDPAAPHWISNRPEAPPSPASETKARVAAAAHAAETASASAPAKKTRARKVAADPKRDPIPEVEAPMLASAVEHVFDDDRWYFELKWDGYRALVRVDEDGAVTIRSRNGLDLLPRYPELRALGDAFSDRPILVDGEIVVLDETGRPSFSALQERSERFSAKPAARAKPVTFVAFDLLYAGGKDLRGEPLEDRKRKLEAILKPSPLAIYSKHVAGDGLALFELARAQGLEGVVGKKRSSRYQSGRSRDWVKLKTALRQEAVVGGWTESKNNRQFRALLVGVYRAGELVFTGAVGSGFDARRLETISARLRSLQRPKTAFVNPPKTETKAHWVEPVLVIEVEFGEWTREGIMRHPRMIGVRDDKPPSDVEREVAPEPSDGAA